MNRLKSAQDDWTMWCLSSGVLLVLCLTVVKVSTLDEGPIRLHGYSLRKSMHLRRLILLPTWHTCTLTVFTFLVQFGNEVSRTRGPRQRYFQFVSEVRRLCFYFVRFHQKFSRMTTHQTHKLRRALYFVLVKICPHGKTDSFLREFGNLFCGLLFRHIFCTGTAAMQ